MRQNMSDLKALIDQLQEERTLTKEEWTLLIAGCDEELSEYLFGLAVKERERFYGHAVYLRGLIEFTNYCRNNCYYCGLRSGNRKLRRYRLTMDEILDCCKRGYEAGYRTFVLQGGEDPWYTDDKIVELLREIKSRYPDCAITLSIGEKEKASYKAYYEAGADRYLLRHETYNPEHYARLHPPELSGAHRQQCLWDLKEIGYQVGTGFMVGAPYQTPENLAEDMCFLKELNPHMVGIGPFIPHQDTPFADKPAGTAALTLFMLGLIRLMLPKVLLPATTALGSIAEDGREKGILAGANIIMPNLTPAYVRADYSLYDHKLTTDGTSSEQMQALERRLKKIGCHTVSARGDSLNV